MQTLSSFQHYLPLIPTPPSQIFLEQLLNPCSVLNIFRCTYKSFFSLFFFLPSIKLVSLTFPSDGPFSLSHAFLTALFVSYLKKKNKKLFSTLSYHHFPFFFFFKQKNQLLNEFSPHPALWSHSQLLHSDFYLHPL